jgi:hypothetical protein
VDLQIEQDLRFTEKEWRAERVGWVVLGVIVLLALAGLFGPGPLSLSQVEGGDDTLTVAYQKYNRSGGPTALQIEADAVLLSSRQFELRVDRSWLGEMLVDRITPQPSQTVVTGDDVIYTFEVSEGNEPVTVVFDMTVAGMGPTTGRVSAGDQAGVTFSQFLYP